MADGSTSTIISTDYETKNAFDEILMKAIKIQGKYWTDLIVGYKTPAIIIINFSSKSDRITVLQELAKYINKAMVPPDELLSKIPRSIQQYDDFLAKWSSAGGTMPKTIESELKSLKGRDVTYFVGCLIHNKNEATFFIILSDPKAYPNPYDITEFLPAIDRYLSKISNSIVKISDDDVSKVWKVLILKNCANCIKENASHRCSTCGVSYYCAKECQVANWKEHKVICNSLRELKISASRLL